MPDTKELVALLGKRFVQRKDIKALQSDDGSWRPDRSPFKMSDFVDHFDGRRTLGHYMLDPEGNCKLFAFDLDLVKHARTCNGRTAEGTTCPGCPQELPGTDGQTYSAIPREIFVMDDHPVCAGLRQELRVMAEGLALNIHRVLGIPVAIATSGHKGLHVYGFTGSVPADAVRDMALGLIDGFGCFEPVRGQNFYRHQFAYHCLEIEVFPKQANLDGKDIGNLMSLPLGIHRKTGKRKFFITTKSRPDVFQEMDAFRVLDGDLPWE